MEKHEDFKCLHGYGDTYGKRVRKKFDMVAQALGAMQAYCDDHNIGIVELFSRFDADGSMSITHDEFKQGIKVRHNTKSGVTSMILSIAYISDPSSRRQVSMCLMNKLSS